MGTFFSILSWTITGAIAGYLASLVLRTARQGCLINIALGIGGAFVGGFVLGNFFPGFFNIFGEGAFAGFLNGIFHAIVGAFILLILIELLVPGKQLGVRREEKAKKKKSKPKFPFLGG